MQHKILLVIATSLLSSSLFAQSMVMYPLTGANTPPSTQPRQTVTLGNIPLAQPNPWILFLKNLQDCVPGTYTLPQIDPVLLLSQKGNVVTNTILGMKKDMCNVIMTYNSSVNPNPSQKNCKLRSSTITLYIERYTNFMNSAQAAAESDEAAFNANMAKDCQ